VAHAANMDLIAVHPVFNLYNRAWPIYSWSEPSPPAKFVFEDEDRQGRAFDSLVSAGAILSGGTVRRSILSPDVVVHSGALVEDSVLLHGVQISRGAVVRRTIIDKNVEVPPGVTIGVDSEADQNRFKVSEGGIVVIGKNQKVLP
jgi:glucose-1-phosphate adenylyltransferase